MSSNRRRSAGTARRSSSLDIDPGITSEYFWPSWKVWAASTERTSLGQALAHAEEAGLTGKAKAGAEMR